jgi:methylmalonyl-CoA/ethylmalonyl-CoA epimerase
MFKFYGYKIIEMVKKIEHIGIAVKNLEEANKTYERLLGIAPYKQEGVASEGVKTSFFQTGESKIELLEGTTEESAITKFVAKKGEGIHHIAFDVEDIHTEMERLRADGFKVLNAEPKDGADNKLVCFVHPKDSHGVLVELCQEKK